MGKVKAEVGEDHSGIGIISSLIMPAVGSVRVVDDFVEKVLCAQSSISSAFKDGRSFEQLIGPLRNGDINPLTCEELILNVVVAQVYDHRRSRRRVTKYFALDHRRLYCMWQAGCKSIRVRIKMCGTDMNGAVNEFFQKSH